MRIVASKIRRRVPMGMKEERRCARDAAWATLVVSHHEIPATNASRAGQNLMFSMGYLLPLLPCLSNEGLVSTRVLGLTMFNPPKLIDRGIGVHQFVQGQGSKALKRRAENSRSSTEVYWTVPNCVNVWRMKGWSWRFQIFSFSGLKQFTSDSKSFMSPSYPSLKGSKCHWSWAGLSRCTRRCLLEWVGWMCQNHRRSKRCYII